MLSNVRVTMSRVRAIIDDPMSIVSAAAAMPEHLQWHLSGKFWPGKAQMFELLKRLPSVTLVDEAVKWQARAVELAPSSEAGILRSRLELYGRGQDISQ
jgi:hypothetical protein